MLVRMLYHRSIIPKGCPTPSDAKLLVVPVRVHKVPHPGGRSELVPCCSGLDELQIFVNSSEGSFIATNVLQVRITSLVSTAMGVASLAIQMAIEKLR